MDKISSIESFSNKPCWKKGGLNFHSIKTLSQVTEAFCIELVKCDQKEEARGKRKKQKRKMSFVFNSCVETKSAKLVLPHHIINRNSAMNAIKPSLLNTLLKKTCLSSNFASPGLNSFNLNQEESTPKIHFNDLIMIDCRFNYEFKGGSIKGSIGISDPITLEHIFVKNRKMFQNKEFKHLFSQYRNSTMSINLFERIKTRFIRTNKSRECSLDRTSINSKINKETRSNSLSFSRLDKEETLNNIKAGDNRFKYNTNELYSYSQRKINQTPCSLKETTPIEHLNNTIIVFFCEFSSKRAPSLYSHLRKIDREFNMEHYPRLFYPNMYLLEGGFSSFVEAHKEHCTGYYRKMLDKQFRNNFLKEKKTIDHIWKDINNSSYLEYDFK